MTNTDQIRHFNRFYTKHLGLLDKSLLQSSFTLTEARVLFEIANRKPAFASEIAYDLGLDMGYMSRIIKKFQSLHYIAKKRTEKDSRLFELALLPVGQTVFEPLNNASIEQINKHLSHLSAPHVQHLIAAMQQIENLLSNKIATNSYLFRELKIGDIGHITSRQGQLYHQEYGWDASYEALVAEILSNYIKKYDAEYESAWIVERQGLIVASVFLVKESHEIARLRLLYVEPSERGSGLGKRLVNNCIEFARSKGYKTMTLWTNDVLTAARKIYLSAGFTLVSENNHFSFGKNLVGQNWQLEL